MHPITGSVRRLAALLGALLLLAAACSSGDDAADVAEGAFSTAEVFAEDGGEAARGVDLDAPAEQAPSDEEDMLGAGGVEPTAFQPSNAGRDIIYTADLTVAVTDVAEAGQEATRVIESLGGFLFGQQTTGAPEPLSILTFKVLPEDFQEALARLG